MFSQSKLSWKKHDNIHMWNCKDETEFLIPKLNMTLKLKVEGGDRKFYQSLKACAIFACR